MTSVIAALVLLLCTAGCSCTNFVENFEEAATNLKENLASMQRMLGAVTSQVMMQQYAIEERARASGKTGVKTVRLRNIGTKSYHVDSHSSFGSLSIHDHSNNIRTVGLGEFSAVLNGIDFATRHNDYRLYMPHRTNMTYGMVEDVPFPDVPPTVKNQANVTRAIMELQEYFRAWRDQNKTHRDYTQYFKPVLCYLEGAWTNKGDTIDEPFFSDRHFLDAKSWTELQQKTRFLAYSGTKSQFENMAYLPTTVMDVVNDTIPVFAQFNYRILCHPIKKEVPLNRFHVVDDLHLRLKAKRNVFQHERSRTARFALSPTDGPYEDMRYLRGFLDELMEEIPGANNYPGYLEDEGLDTPALEWDGKTKKDVSRYHRVFKIGRRDATGLSTVNRGYNDDFLFAAMTNQTKVAGMKLKKRCRWTKVAGKWTKNCPVLKQKWTWALPLEIIFLTPLHKWNPYNLEYKGDSRSDEGKTITEGGRNGGCDPGKAFKGINSQNYYQTPKEFFGSRHSSSSADTVRGLVCVEDKNGVVRQVQASGVRAFLPKISDVGALRIRYPIFPAHEEGSTAWKEMEALKELVMDPKTYGKYFWTPSNEDESDDLNYQLSDSTKSGVSKHRHNLVLTQSQLKSLKFGVEIKVTTDTEAGHQHELQLRYQADKDEVYGYKCDGRWWRCWDGHRTKPLIKVNVSDI